jgi:hypothetical protein
MTALAGGAALADGTGGGGVSPALAALAGAEPASAARPRLGAACRPVERPSHDARLMRCALL